MALDEPDGMVECARPQRSVDHDEIGAVDPAGDPHLDVGHALVDGEHQSGDVVRAGHARRVGRVPRDEVSAIAAALNKPRATASDDLGPAVAAHGARRVRRAHARAVAVDPHASVDAAHAVDKQNSVGPHPAHASTAPLPRRQLDVDDHRPCGLGFELSRRAVLDVPRIDGELHAVDPWIVDVRGPFTTS